MKWYHYLACFVAGVFLIHALPHLLNGFSLINVIGVIVSLGVGSLLLWAGKFSIKNTWTLLLVVAGMISVFLFLLVHPHKAHAPTNTVQSSATFIIPTLNCTSQDARYPPLALEERPLAG
jgi:hypothetical protein